MEILYEDRFLIVCAKEPGVLSEEGSGKNMPALIREHLKMPGAYVGAVHRLDREAGGAIVYAKDAATAAKLSGQIADRLLEKTYLALLERPPAEDTGTLFDLLYHDRGKNKTYVVSRARRGVREASLSFEVLRRFSVEGKSCGLLRIRLDTGRTHQIRVQFASRKMPLLGDRKYGSSFRFPAVALWCESLSFPHPETGERISLRAPLPENSPWNLI